MRRLIPLTAALLLGLPAAASADSRLESMFQDDPRILSKDAKVRDATLDEAQALGVQRIRVTAFWNRHAPNATGTEKPADFDGSNPDAYEAGQFDVLDAVIRGAKERGLKVNLNPSAPGPKWAGSAFIEPRLDGVTNPSPIEYAAFVAALGRRYSGSFTPAGGTAGALPRVDYWSIWNEPNQGAWLAPQWEGTGASATEASPRRYRVALAGAWAALEATGHTVETDTILVGDTAPQGLATVKSVASAMSPVDFINRLYCLDDDLQILKGADAKAHDCAEKPDPAAFVTSNPALFQMTGYAHHPYELGFKPDRAPDRPKKNVTMANLGLLTDQLDRMMARYQVKRSSVPLYLTEYGYQTNPPDALGVTLNEQAAYINEGEYIAWRNKRVRTLSQFLLVDDAPIPGTTKKDKWSSSFQTGLRFGPESGREGRAKPALNAYRVAFFLPQRKVSSKRVLKVWGRVRPGSGKRKVQLQVRGAKGSYKSFRTLTTNTYGFVNSRVRVRTSHRAARLAWKDGKKTFYSRGVSFKVRR